MQVKLDTSRYDMTYQEIADQLNKENYQGGGYSANSIKRICLKALDKLTTNNTLLDYHSA